MIIILLLSFTYKTQQIKHHGYNIITKCFFISLYCIHMHVFSRTAVCMVQDKKQLSIIVIITPDYSQGNTLIFIDAY